MQILTFVPSLVVLNYPCAHVLFTLFSYRISEKGSGRTKSILADPFMVNNYDSTKTKP